MKTETPLALEYWLPVLDRLEALGRWAEAGVESVLTRLWDGRQRGTGVLVCLGFAPDARSLPALLDRLQSTTTFRQRHRPALVRTWADPHGRAFTTTAALWQVPQQD